MNDIVKRIREAGAWNRGPYCPCADDRFERDSAPFEAADEIERLENRISALELAAQNVTWWLESTMPEGDAAEIMRPFDGLLK